MLDLIAAQMVDIAGELAVQEGLGILADGFDQGEMRQRHHNGLIAGCLKFLSGIAEVQNFVRGAVENGLRGFQKAAPIGVHECS